MTMDEAEYKKFVEENEKELGVIIGFMEYHNITEITIHEPKSDKADVTMDLVFAEQEERAGRK